MSQRFSFGNMDEYEPETEKIVEKQRMARIAKHREPIITPLRKKWFWQRWYDYLKNGFRKHSPIDYETNL